MARTAAGSAAETLRVEPGAQRRLGAWWHLRALALVTLTAYGTTREPGLGWLWPATIALLVGFAAEPVLRRLVPRDDALSLPGYDAARTPWPALAVVPCSLLVLALLAVLGLTRPDATVQLWWLAAGLQLLLQATAALTLWRVWQRRGERVRQLREALAAYRPEFAVYTSLGSSHYQLRMWLPLLERFGRRYVVVTRRHSALPGLATVTSAPVVARRTWRDLDDIVVPSLRAAFYVNSIADNAELVTHREMTHVYLGHGESEKALSSHPAHAMYDQVFVAGQAAIDRYQRFGVLIPREKLVVVGRPQVAALGRPRAPVADISDPVILYAPTWAGYNAASSYSSLPVGARIVRALLDRPGTVLFRPHPLSRRRAAERDWLRAVEDLLAQDRARTGRPHRLAEDGDFVDAANAADALVADLSSVLTDFLHADKPMAVVAAGASADILRRDHPVARAAYVVESDLSNLEQVLDEMLGPDPLAADRPRVKAELGWGDAAGTEAVLAFEQAVLAILDGS